MTMIEQRKVKFKEFENETYEIPKSDREQWYQAKDYGRFISRLQDSRTESITGVREENKFPMEFYEKFGTKVARRNRGKLAKKVLHHQNTCREQGFPLNPDELSQVSMELSKEDRTQAYLHAAANAYETEFFRREDAKFAPSTSNDVLSPQLVYYLDSAYDVLSRALLCECY